MLEKKRTKNLETISKLKFLISNKNIQIHDSNNTKYDSMRKMKMS